MINVKPTRVLFVCLGNICRSPTAEGVFTQLVELNGIAHQFEIDSAGTGDYHIGSAPDPRAQTAALERGYDIRQLKARQVTTDDFNEFDYILAMDQMNYTDLSHIAGTENTQNLHLFLQFASLVEEDEVPDPYFGGQEGFNVVIDMIEQASQGLLDHIMTKAPSSA